MSFCQRWKVKELALFGSVLRSDFRIDSDIDMLVSFEESARWGLLSHAKMQQELEDIFGREVDLIEREAIEASPNWIRRSEILKTARVMYAN